MPSITNTTALGGRFIRHPGAFRPFSCTPQPWDACKPLISICDATRRRLVTPEFPTTAQFCHESPHRCASLAAEKPRESGPQVMAMHDPDQEMSEITPNADSQTRKRRLGPELTASNR